MRKIQVAVIITGFGWLCISCQHKPEEIKQMAAKEASMSAETGTGIAITYYDSGYLKARIFTPLMERKTEQSNAVVVMKNGLTAHFYDRNRRIISTLKAGHGTSYEQKRLVHLKDSVHLVNLDEEEFDSEELFWNQQEQKIYTRKFVTIRRKNELIYGDGFESNETFSKYRIMKPRGRVSIKENE